MVHSDFIQKQSAFAGLRWFDTSYMSIVLKNMSIVAQFHSGHDTSGAPVTYLGVFYSKIANVNPGLINP